MELSKPLKRCTKCKQLKPLSDFHKHKRKKDGHCYQCKKCVSERGKQKYQENKEEIQKKSKQYYQENREIILEKQHSDKIRQRNLESARKYATENPEIINAHWKLQQAIRRGEITRPLYCDSCKKEGDIHGHHEDYSKPLEVIWLCQECHERLHAQN